MRYKSLDSKLADMLFEESETLADLAALKLKAWHKKKIQNQHIQLNQTKQNPMIGYKSSSPNNSPHMATFTITPVFSGIIAFKTHVCHFFLLN